MTKHIRRKLVWGYTFAIIIITIATANIGVCALNHFIASSYRQSLLPLLEIEMIEALPELQEWFDGQQVPEIGDIDDPNHVMVLEYIFDRNGQLVMSEGTAAVTDFFQQQMPTWSYENRKAILLKFASEKAELSIFTMADDIYDNNGVLLGKVIVGINISPIELITHNYLIASSLIIVLVSIMAYFVGNYFARKAVRPIEVSMQTQQDFVANASHELRTPLSILLSSVDMLEAQDSEIVKDMKDEILQMRELINSLLILTQPESNANKGFSTFNLVEVAENTLKSIQLLADKKNIKLSANIEDAGIFHGDQLKICQLLKILLDNAIKYSPDGSNVMLKIKQKNTFVEINVIDNGSGIAVKELSQVFERFYRSDNSRANSEGFGLGLAIAKFISEMHNGTIKIDSAVGKGTSVAVTLRQRSQL